MEPLTVIIKYTGKIIIMVLLLSSFIDTGNVCLISFFSFKKFVWIFLDPNFEHSRKKVLEVKFQANVKHN